MNLSTAHSQLQSWLESRRWSRAEEAPFSIALQCTDGEICAQIGGEIAQYLSEVHVGSPHGWLFFEPKLLKMLLDKEIRADLVEFFPDIAARTSDLGAGEPSLLLDIVRIGGAVLALPEARARSGDYPDLFVVGLTDSAPGAVRPSNADLILDLSRINRRTAVRVIADSALEWAAARTSPAA